MDQTGWHLRDITTRNLAMPYHWKLGSSHFTPYYQHQDGRLTMGHNGGDFGVATQMFFDPKNDVGAILLMNRYVNGYRAWKDVLDIQRRLFQV